MGFDQRLLTASGGCVGCFPKRWLRRKEVTVDGGGRLKENGKGREKRENEKMERERERERERESVK